MRKGGAQAVGGAARQAGSAANSMPQRDDAASGCGVWANGVVKSGALTVGDEEADAPS